ncbi:tetratricopeptide repeat protein [Novosphingobium aquiterrae]|uniref:Tetratricopeptide repeat protein n=1 Tax=Novosphingobium aquiterrae TaxID=624388 RepID=A0ABV6PGS9_9SPHN
MTWVAVLALAGLTFAAIVFAFKVPRSGWEAVGAALMFGAAGFAWQGRPAQSGAPKAAAEVSRPAGAALVEARKQLSAQGENQPNSWAIIADALARNGSYSDAAGVLLGAVRKDPGNADAWLAMANDLVAHADGTLTPAAQYAYDRAAKADPAHPGPAFFLGLALATNGKLDEGRDAWAALLARAPKGAPWRADLEQRLARLDDYIAAQSRTDQAR